MIKVGKRYRNRYTGKAVTVKAIESVRIGPDERHIDVIVLDGGDRWAAWGVKSTFFDCHEEVNNG